MFFRVSGQFFRVIHVMLLFFTYIMNQYSLIGSYIQDIWLICKDDLLYCGVLFCFLLMHHVVVNLPVNLSCSC